MTDQAAAEPAIRVQGLVKSYKELDVLRGVDCARTSSGDPAECCAG